MLDLFKMEERYWRRKRRRWLIWVRRILSAIMNMPERPWLIWARRNLPAIVDTLERPWGYIDKLIWRVVDFLLQRMDQGARFLLFWLALGVFGAYGAVRLFYWLLNLSFACCGLWLSLLFLCLAFGALVGLRWGIVKLLRREIQRIDPDSVL